MTRLAIVGLVLLYGCAPLIWDKPGGTQDGFNQDLARCRYEAKLALAGRGYGSTRGSLSGAGGQGVGEGISEAIDQRELMKECLVARGYTAQR